MIRSLLPLAVLLALVPGAFGTPAQEGMLAIEGARILTVGGSEIERGTILVQSGKIAAVGAEVAVPPGARVIPADGKVVMPGLVDANARFGMRGSNEEASEVTPAVRASHLLDPRNPQLRRALRGGVTTACLTPGSANVIGGLCALIKTAGESLDELLLDDSVALRAALGADVTSGNTSFRGAGNLTNLYGRRPNSRMGAVWELRRALFEGRDDPVISRALAGTLPLRIHARTENDLRAALTIAAEFQLPRVILDDAAEAHRAAELLAERGVSVALGPFRDPQSRGPEGTDLLLNTAGLLAEAGVPVAIASGGGDPTQLLAWAGFAARAGLAPEQALRAVTLDAARLVGAEARVGSIEVGKDADLLILSGDPFDLTTRIEQVIVEGRVEG